MHQNRRTTGGWSVADRGSDRPHPPTRTDPPWSDVVREAEVLLLRLREAADNDTSAPAVEALTSDEVVRRIGYAAMGHTPLRVYLGMHTAEEERALAALARRPAGTEPSQVLVTAPSMRAAATCSMIREVVEAGTEVRLPPHPSPLFMLLAADRPALLQSGRWAPVAVETPSLRVSLSSMFDALWAVSSPVQVNGLENDPSLPADRRMEVLLYLADGVKDVSAARAMGVSVRTYRRYVAKIMDEMGATSRFQAGALAASSGRLGRLEHEGPVVP